MKLIMKHLLISFLFLVATHTLAQEKPIIVVELFTSEGCSSCPPADRLLSSIINEEHSEAEVIGLSFHVDYWNYIGWKDPYSDASYSKRQRAYANKLISSVYTPQMVVNGTHRFVGSDRSDWREAYAKEKSAKVVTALDIKSVELKGRVLSFAVDGVEGKRFVNAAVVERDLSQDVSRGENRGRRLSHDNVVRAFEAKKDDQYNSFQLTLPDDLDLTKSSLVVYTQHPATWQINGAKKIELTSIQ